MVEVACPPPAYEHGLGHAILPPLKPIGLTHPPTQRLSIVQANEKLRATILLDSRAGPYADVSDPDTYLDLKTSNASLEANVYVAQSDVLGVAHIKVETSNAYTSLAILARQPDQALDLAVKTSNSNIDLALPADFDGPVDWTGGKIGGTPDFLSTRLHIREQTPGGGDGYITPAPGHGTATGDRKSAGQLGGRDKLSIQTSNGKIRLS